MNMDRRTFIRIVGGVGLTSAVPFRYVVGADPARTGSTGVLVEAAGFDEPGGWKLDTQHYQQMGGCYLLAHGMGKPVANARTKVVFSKTGTWHVWVRTRNWCPGNWRAPGRFKLRVGGATLAMEFGAEGERWHWEKGGTVEIASPGAVEVELEDLTGFDGRCDAIYFDREPSPVLPNDDLRELAAWKDRLAGRADLEIEENTCDVVIIGGGMTGCAAALAARSQGLKVALVQDRPVFGGCTSEEIRVHTLGIHGKSEDIISKIDTTIWYPNGDEKAKEDQVKRERSMDESGAELFRSHIAIGLGKDGDRITSVEARDVRTGKIRRFLAPVFIDATGDAWLGYWAGADYRYGRESREEFGEGWDHYGERWSPKGPDNKILGTSVIWNSEQTNTPSRFPEVPWAMPVAKDHEAINGDWYWEYSADHLHQVDAAEQIRDHLLGAIFGAFSNAMKYSACRVRFGVRAG